MRRKMRRSEWSTIALTSSGSPSGAHVLDVGCGHGGTLIHLARSLSCTGTGLTLSPKQARLAREHSARAGVERRVNFEVANADHFQFPASAFDLVWTMESSEHFADKSRYFAMSRTPCGRAANFCWRRGRAPWIVPACAKWGGHFYVRSCGRPNNISPRSSLPE